MTKKLKKRLYRILIGAACFAAAITADAVLSDELVNIKLAAYLIAYFVIGKDVIRNGINNIVKLRPMDEKFLMLVASFGAFMISECSEGVAVMLFYQVGEWFQSYAVGKSRKSIQELMNIRPDYANVMRGADAVTVDPAEVGVGERILVKPGERIPLDGVIESGQTSIDTAALTGESLPKEGYAGCDVISGCVNLTGVITVRVTKAFSESTVSKILELVENASSRKSESEAFITKFAKYYTPIVVWCAVLLGVIPPLFFGGKWYEWVYRALAFLVVSCPCALVISIPLSFFGGLGGGSKVGILVKGSNYLEALSHVDTVVLDKTGTLTKGNFVVTEVMPARIMDEPDELVREQMRDTLLKMAAYAESASNHPISKALLAAYGENIDSALVSDRREDAGYGVTAIIDGKVVLVGNAKHLFQNGIEGIPFDDEKTGTLVYVAIDGAYAGCIFITDEIREDAKAAIAALKRVHVDRIVMLTGDRKETAKAVADRIGITEVFAELLPDEKVARLEEIFEQRTGRGKVAFVGDGMNDAPVLARSDVGIAMGGLGSDAAIEAADVVIMTDEPSKIAQGIQIAARTVRIARQNTFFALFVKVSILILAACGLASMWVAVFGDVGVAFLAILNAMRAMHVKNGTGCFADAVEQNGNEPEYTDGIKGK